MELGIHTLHVQGCGHIATLSLAQGASLEETVQLNNCNSHEGLYSTLSLSLVSLCFPESQCERTRDI